MAQFVEASFHRLKVAGLIPSQGTFSDYGFDALLGWVWEGSWSMFLSHTDVRLSVSPSFSLSLKAMKKIPLGEDRKKKSK